MAVTDIGWTSQEEIEAGLPVPGHVGEALAVAVHTEVTSDVHGIDDTSALVVTADLADYVGKGTTAIAGDLSADSTTVPAVVKDLLEALDTAGVISDTTTTT
jgi:hypothetical protein